VNALERLEELRRRTPDIAGGLVCAVVDNPAQFALVASGSFVITRAIGRLVRPTGLASGLMTATASYALCTWLLAEARRRGLITFRVRHPVTGELVTLAELGAGPCPCGECGSADPPG